MKIEIHNIITLDGDFAKSHLIPFLIRESLCQSYVLYTLGMYCKDIGQVQS